jgi:methylisocitrate lyase
MSAAALHAYQTLRREGSQRDLLDQLQTRADLYDVLNYHEYEAKLDRLFQKEPHND